MDGKKAAGSLGGTVDNSQDSNSITDIVVEAGDPDGVGSDFALIKPSDTMGLAWEDFNNDGEVNFAEKAIDDAVVTLTGKDDRGATVNLSVNTDTDGVYTFVDLRPSNAAGYTISGSQPNGFLNGKDILGTVNGQVVGDTSVNDTFHGVVMPRPGSRATDYNFGERPESDGDVEPGQTATIGFWQNKNGQKLIKALGGEASDTQLGGWLAATFPKMYGADAAANDLTGKTNAEVAEFYRSLFSRNKKTDAGGGPPKMDAQVMATALAVYVTNETLAGQTAAGYGFTVTTTGVGTRTVNVGNQGAAFGAANNTSLQVLDLLLAVNQRAHAGVLYDLDADGDADNDVEKTQRTMANDLLSAINESG